MNLFDFENAACGLATLDENMYFLAANATLAELLHTDTVKLRGQALDRFLSSAQRLLFHMQAVAALHVNGRVDEIVVNFQNARGHQVPMLFNAICRMRGNIKVIECVFVRVNERKRLEDELFNIKKAVEQVPGMVYQYLRRADGSTCFPYASEGARTVYEIMPVHLLQSAEKVLQRIHPDDRDAVQASIEASARDLTLWKHKYRVNLPQRGTRWLEGQAMPESRTDGSVLWHGYISDITESFREYKDVEHRATHDHLTGIANRAEFDRQLSQMVVSARTGASTHALCYVDLDHFKVVNDTLGHAAGDLLLRNVATVLQSALETTCARRWRACSFATGRLFSV